MPRQAASALRYPLEQLYSLLLAKPNTAAVDENVTKDDNDVDTDFVANS
jgi:hypothetical protein